MAGRFNPCPRCGAPLPEESSFCPHCAQSVRSRRDVVIPVHMRRKKVRLALWLAGLALLLVALTAIYRTVAARLERNLGGTAATVAPHVVHGTVAAVLAILLAAIGTAGRATAGLILEALVGIELLFRSGKNKFRAALTANQRLVFKHEKKPS